MGKFLKNWGALTVAIIAVVTSVCALYLDYEHSERALKSLQDSDARHDEQFATAMNIAEEANELAGEANELAGEATGLAGKANELAGEALKADEQHAKHTELGDDLSMLYNRLTRQSDWLMEIHPYVRETAEGYYYEAKYNFDEARTELRADNFDRVQELIEVADVKIDECYTAAKLAAVELGIELPVTPAREELLR